MTEGQRLVQSMVEELSSLLNVAPKVIYHFKTYLTESLNNNILYESSYVPDAVDFIYNKDDNEIYSIIALSSETNGYLCIVMPQMPRGLIAIWKEYINDFKRKFPEYQGEKLGNIIRELNLLYNHLKVLIQISIRSTRKSNSQNKPDWEPPSLEELERFYKCERKRPHDTYEDAYAALQGTQEVYKCTFCDKFHCGKPLQKGMVIPLSVQHKRWETTWRRKHNV